MESSALVVTFPWQKLDWSSSRAAAAHCSATFGNIRHRHIKYSVYISKDWSRSRSRIGSYYKANTPAEESAWWTVQGTSLRFIVKYIHTCPRFLFWFQVSVTTSTEALFPYWVYRMAWYRKVLNMCQYCISFKPTHLRRSDRFMPHKEKVWNHWTWYHESRGSFCDQPSSWPGGIYRMQHERIFGRYKWLSLVSGHVDSSYSSYWWHAV
jgi:hypothetical protein